MLNFCEKLGRKVLFAQGLGSDLGKDKFPFLVEPVTSLVEFLDPVRF